MLGFFKVPKCNGTNHLVAQFFVERELFNLTRSVIN